MDPTCTDYSVLERVRMKVKINYKNKPNVGKILITSTSVIFYFLLFHWNVLSSFNNIINVNTKFECFSCFHGFYLLKKHYLKPFTLLSSLNLLSELYPWVNSIIWLVMFDFFRGVIPQPKVWFRNRALKHTLCLYLF